MNMTNILRSTSNLQLLRQLILFIVLLMLASNSYSQYLNKTYSAKLKQANKFYFKENNYNDAILLYKDILEMYPFHIESLVNYADISYHNLKEYGQAYETYNIAIVELDNAIAELRPTSDKKSVKQQIDFYNDILKKCKQNRDVCYSNIPKIIEEEISTEIPEVLISTIDISDFSFTEEDFVSEAVDLVHIPANEHKDVIISEVSDLANKYRNERRLKGIYSEDDLLKINQWFVVENMSKNEEWHIQLSEREKDYTQLLDKVLEDPTQNSINNLELDEAKNTYHDFHKTRVTHYNYLEIVQMDLLQASLSSFCEELSNDIYNSVLEQIKNNNLQDSILNETVQNGETTGYNKIIQSYNPQLEQFRIVSFGAYDYEGVEELALIIDFKVKWYTDVNDMPLAQSMENKQDSLSGESVVAGATVQAEANEDYSQLEVEFYQYNPSSVIGYNMDPIVGYRIPNYNELVYILNNRDKYEQLNWPTGGELIFPSNEKFRDMSDYSDKYKCIKVSDIDYNLEEAKVVPSESMFIILVKD